MFMSTVPTIEAGSFRWLNPGDGNKDVGGTIYYE